MRSHEVEYQVYGDDLQFAEVVLDPAESVIAEGGAMMCLEDGIDFETVMGDGSEPDAGIFGKLKSAGRRVISGESLFMTHFTNRGGGIQRVAYAAPYPGKIVPVDLAVTNGRLICQKDAFLCAAMGVKIDIVFNKEIGTGIFGGEGFILQELAGDGLVFLHAGGTITEKRLTGDRLRVDTGCLVAFEETIEYSIERAGKLKSQVFGGEGLFLATLQGTGRVWLQSLPLSRLADKIAPMGGGVAQGEGSVVGGISTIFER